MRKLIRTFLIVTALITTSVPAWAQDADQGQREFLAHCAGCHGSDAKGDGPQSLNLAVKPPDLTLLAKRNNGVFAPGLIYQMIDGRKARINHGSDNMPIWGCRHVDASAPPPVPPTDTMTPFHPRRHVRHLAPPKANHEETLESLLDLACDSDAAIQDRILSIVGYLSLIQE